MAVRLEKYLSAHTFKTRDLQTNQSSLSEYSRSCLRGIVISDVAGNEICGQTSRGGSLLTARPVERAAVCMLFLQSAINPLVYGVMNRNFREVCKNLFRDRAARR